MFTWTRTHKEVLKALLYFSHDMDGAAIASTDMVPHAPQPWCLNFEKRTRKFYSQEVFAEDMQHGFSDYCLTLSWDRSMNFVFRSKISARFLAIFCCYSDNRTGPIVTEFLENCIVGSVVDWNSSFAKSCCHNSFKFLILSRCGVSSEDFVVSPEVGSVAKYTEYWIERLMQVLYHLTGKLMHHGQEKMVERQLVKNRQGMSFWEGGVYESIKKVFIRNFSL